MNDTFGKLAFCSAYRPGQSDEAPLMQALAAILGRAVRDDEAPALRRLHFEASTMIMSDMKSRVERTDASEPKRLPMAERTARLERQKTDLVGVVINQDNEPSHQLVDRVFNSSRTDVWFGFRGSSCLQGPKRHSPPRKSFTSSSTTRAT